MMWHNIILLLSCAFTKCVGYVKDSSPVRNPFACVHTHNAQPTSHNPLMVTPGKKTQTHSAWHVVEQKGSVLVMQHADGRIREITVSQTS